MSVTREQVQAVTGNADKWFVPLRDAMDLNSIDGVQRMSMFLAQCAHESMGFSRLVENLNYSPGGLMVIFGRHFTAQESLEFAHDEERIANRVYGGRLGNGSEDSGDGFRYRGRGLIHVTGRDNYAQAGRAVGVDLVALPDLASMPLYAGLIAGWYWRSHGCNELADAGDYEAITKRINGGLNGWDDRQARLTNIERALA
jgi:putative chitinase